MSAPSAFSLPPSRDHQLISTSLQHAAECCLHGVGGGGDIARANADFIGSLNKLKDVSDVTQLFFVLLLQSMFYSVDFVAPFCKRCT